MTLRTKLVDAGARAQVYDFDALELSTQRFYLEVSERVVDAFLDCLAENADDRVELLNGWGDINDLFLEDIQVSDLIAALRDRQPTEEDR